MIHLKSLGKAFLLGLLVQFGFWLLINVVSGYQNGALVCGEIDISRPCGIGEFMLNTFIEIPVVYTLLYNMFFGLPTILTTLFIFFFVDAKAMKKSAAKAIVQK
jgi:hypothetical protein